MGRMRSGWRKAGVFVGVIGGVILGGRWVHREMQFTGLRTPLIEAVQTNYTAEVRSLLEQGADPNVHVGYKPEPFSWQHVLRLFRLRSPLPPPEGLPILIDAAQSDRDDIVRLLLEHGADVDARDNSYRQWTALHYAADYRALATVKVLLAHGANVHARDGSGETPLFEAVRRDESEAGYPPGQSCVALLLDHGADPRSRADDGDTPLVRAAGIPRYDSTLQLLLAHGADVQASGAEGRTALMLAATWGRPEGVDLLLAAGAKRDAQDNAGRTALQYALRTLDENKDLIAFRPEAKERCLAVIRRLRR